MMYKHLGGGGGGGELASFVFLGGEVDTDMIMGVKKEWKTYLK